MQIGSARRSLNLGRALKDPVARSRRAVDDDDELGHRGFLYLGMVAFGLSIEDWIPASGDMVKFSISSGTQPL